MKLKLKLLLLTPVAVFTAIVFGFIALSLLEKQPVGLGVQDGRLAACPDKPNCVHSQSDDPRHAIEPLPLNESAQAAIRRLAKIVQQMPRSRVVRQTENYLHAEFDSFVFRFTDDTEFYADPDASVIHIRSAARSGHSDLGVNRRRMEKIRHEFESALPKPSATGRSHGSGESTPNQ